MSKTFLPIQLSLNINTNHRDRPYHDVEASAANNPGLPTLWGIPLKYLSLVTLAVQNSALTLVMHYSRVSTPPSRTYLAATAVLMNEILKGLISVVIAYSRVDISTTPFEPTSNRTWIQRSLLRWGKLSKEILSPDCWKLSIPAILYVIQNNLQYVAVSHLEAATFQVSYQMKILTTAGFSVLLLRKKLHPPQWIALLCLALGVGIVQIQATSDAHSNPSSHQHTEGNIMNPLKGFLAVAAACFTSGLAGVYFEMVLKSSQADLWVRNVQLSLFSLLPALAPIIVYQRTQPSQANGLILPLFENFGAWAWATVLIQVFGGLVTALVIKYSDNILKGFATSLSIVISFLASVALFNFQMSITFLLGSSVVLIATWLYNQPPGRTSAFGHAAPKDSWMLFKIGEPKDESLRSPVPNSPGHVAFSAISTSSSTSSLCTLTGVSPSSNAEARPYP